MKHIHYYIVLLLVIFLTACSDISYKYAIPKNSVAIVSFDVNKISGVNNTTLLKALLHLKNLDKSGIDLTKNVYLFQSADGNIGICAKVESTQRLEKMFRLLQQTPTKFREAYFATVNNSWVAAYNDNALLLMGPVAPDKQDETKAIMAKYLNNNEEKSILASPLYQKLDSLDDSPMAMVAQAKAFPDQFIAPLMLGAPKGTTPADVLIAAKMNVKNGCWYIQGKPFSMHKPTNQAIDKAMKIYRPITQKYITAMPDTAAFGMFVNVDGKQFLPLLQNNKALQVLLTGINQAIDLDNIIRSVDGDMSIVIPQYKENKINMSMAAQLSHTHWLADVDYWKQSVPQGGKIINWQKNAYAYTNGTTSFYFGTTRDLQFYSGSNKITALASIHPSKQPLPINVQQQIKGEKMVMIINLSHTDNATLRMFTQMLKPVFGSIHTIIYKGWF